MSALITEKRLRNELKDLKKNKLDFAQAIQDENDKFIFYFLLVGDKEDPKNKAGSGHYEGGYYVGKIMLPQNYPDKPGDFMMLTPNGRFDIGKKICLTNSGYHSETWTPIWSIRNMIIGFASIFYVDLDTGISHIKMPKDKRLNMAHESIKYNMTNYKDIFTKFDQFIDENGKVKPKESVVSIPEQVKVVEPIKEVTKEPVKPNFTEAEIDDMMIKEAIEASKLEDKKKQLQLEEDEKQFQLALQQIQQLEDAEVINAVIEEKKEQEVEEAPKKVLKIKTSSKPVTKAISKTTVINNVANDVNTNNVKVIQNIKPEQSTKKTKSDLINDKMEIIKKMTYKTFDIKVFKEVHNLRGLSLNDL